MISVPVCNKEMEVSHIIFTKEKESDSSSSVNILWFKDGSKVLPKRTGSSWLDEQPSRRTFGPTRGPLVKKRHSSQIESKVKTQHTPEKPSHFTVQV